MGKKHKKHKSDRHFYEGEERPACPRSRAAPARKARPAEIPRRGGVRLGPAGPAGRSWGAGRWAPALGLPRVSPRPVLLFQSTWRSP